MPAIRGIVRDAAKNQNRMSSFILGVVKSPAFRMSTTSEPASNRRATDVAAQQNRYGLGRSRRRNCETRSEELPPAEYERRASERRIANSE